MEKNTSIRNLDSLNYEISRLQLDAKLKETKLRENIEYLRGNFPAMATNSFFGKKSSKKTRSGFVDSLFKKPFFTSIASTVRDHICELAADRFNNLADKFFKKKSR